MHQVNEQIQIQSIAGVMEYHWRQEWVKNSCLAIILTMLLFVMIFSIFLVASKPVPVSPESGQSFGGNSSFVSAPAVYKNNV
ncbi:MAG: hypothetical protein KAR42_02660 [candidate division Zixibacteria bacterium]|nr:hypothetical protein [candidate division Zixibacteria bacterium]